MNRYVLTRGDKQSYNLSESLSCYSKKREGAEQVGNLGNGELGGNHSQPPIDNCMHPETIDSGDAEHTAWICIKCGQSLHLL